jgi:hypothetical protein
MELYLISFIFILLIIISCSIIHNPVAASLPVWLSGRYPNPSPGCFISSITLQNHKSEWFQYFYQHHNMDRQQYKSCRQWPQCHIMAWYSTFVHKISYAEDISYIYYLIFQLGESVQVKICLGELLTPQLRTR